jgi:lipid-binding SYLF domain-containing protein
MRKVAVILGISLVFCVGLGRPARAEYIETEIVLTASDVLRELSKVPDHGIPNKLLREASAVAIFPGVIKAGFVIGGRHGRGVIAIRHEDGSWSNPLLISITGGSIGFQAGAESTDLVLIFRSHRGIDAFLSGRGKLKLGADVSIAAGPVGRESGAATDGRLKSEIFSYSRSRGLFAGASLSGSSLKPDFIANEIYYASEELTPKEILTRTDIPVRESTQKLKDTLTELSPPPQPPVVE